MSATARQAGAGGFFATAPRYSADVLEIERLHRRGMGVQNIAKITGASMEDVRRIIAPKPVEPAPSPIPANDADEWPLGECSDLAKNVIRYVAKQHGVQVSDVPLLGAGPKVNAARNAMYAAIMEFCPELTLIDVAVIFQRDPASVVKGAAAHNRAAFGEPAQ